MHFSVDLNCDMGEGMPHDALIMPFISSANIACGFHAGDERIMQRTIELALQYNVAIGAHPSFPDKENFGRINMQLSPDRTYEIVKEQIETLANIAAKNNCILHHVKPHGALYNMAAKDEELAEVICKAVAATNKSLFIYALSGSKLIDVATSMNLRTCNEVFADRTYEADGSLTSRSSPNALLLNEDEVKEQVLQMITKGTIKADTICIHGDGAHAVLFAKAIHSELFANNILIRSA